MSTAAPSNPVLPKSSWYYKDSRSDKEYHLLVVPADAESGDGYFLEFSYGRRGDSLKAGRKNATPLSLEAATALYESEVKVRERKGYTQGESGMLYMGTDKQDQVSGLLPQLLNFIPEEAVQKYIDDDDYLMQEKYDGVRRLIRSGPEGITGVNKKGLTKPIPQEIHDDLHATLGQVSDGEGKRAIIELDGEQVGVTLWVFDLLRLGDTTPAYFSYKLAVNADLETRLKALDALLFAFPRKSHIRMVESFRGRAAKQTAFDEIRIRGGEGVTFKKRDSVYRAGRPNKGGDQVKFKFYSTATVRVSRVSIGKRSVYMEVLGQLVTTDQWTSLGKVTIPANQPIPKVGDFIEVRYLYGYKGGSLFQTTCLGIRDDVDYADCGIEQIKWKNQPAEGEDDEDTTG